MALGAFPVSLFPKRKQLSPVDFVGIIKLNTAHYIAEG